MSFRDFLVHSRDLDSFHCPARPHGQSYNNCWAGLWGTAGAQQECCGCRCIWAGSTAMGRDAGTLSRRELPLPALHRRNVMLLHLNRCQRDSGGTQRLHLEEPACQL